MDKKFKVGMVYKVVSTKKANGIELESKMYFFEVIQIFEPVETLKGRDSQVPKWKKAISLYGDICNEITQVYTDGEGEEYIYLPRLGFKVKASEFKGKGVC